MKKIIAAIMLFLALTSGAWADCPPCPRCPDPAPQPADDDKEYST